MPITKEMQAGIDEYQVEVDARVARHPSGSTTSFLDSLNPNRQRRREGREILTPLVSAFYASPVEFLSSDSDTDLNQLAELLHATGMQNLTNAVVKSARVVDTFVPFQARPTSTDRLQPHLYERKTTVSGLSIIGVDPGQVHSGALRRVLSEGMRRYPVVADVGVDFKVASEEADQFLDAHAASLAQAHSTEPSWRFLSGNADTVLVFDFPVEESEGEALIKTRVHPNRLSDSPQYQALILEKAAGIVNLHALPLVPLDTRDNETVYAVHDFTPEYEY